MVMHVLWLHPLKHSASALPQLIPTMPRIQSPAAKHWYFLTYPPGFPGKPNPQQHILAPDPLAPHISIMAMPFEGAIHPTQLLSLNCVNTVAGVNVYIVPFSRLACALDL
jgi:hypothetical protein